MLTAETMKRPTYKDDHCNSHTHAHTRTHTHSSVSLTGDKESFSSQILKIVIEPETLDNTSGRSHQRKPAESFLHLWIWFVHNVAHTHTHIHTHAHTHTANLSLYYSDMQHTLCMKHWDLWLCCRRSEHVQPNSAEINGSHSLTHTLCRCSASAWKHSAVAGFSWKSLTSRKMGEILIKC